MNFEALFFSITYLNVFQYITVQNRMFKPDVFYWFRPGKMKERRQDLVR